MFPQGKKTSLRNLQLEFFVIRRTRREPTYAGLFVRESLRENVDARDLSWRVIQDPKGSFVSARARLLKDALDEINVRLHHGPNAEFRIGHSLVGLHRHLASHRGIPIEKLQSVREKFHRADRNDEAIASVL